MIFFNIIKCFFNIIQFDVISKIHFVLLENVMNFILLENDMNSSIIRIFFIKMSF